MLLCPPGSGKSTVGRELRSCTARSGSWIDPDGQPAVIETTGANLLVGRAFAAGVRPRRRVDLAIDTEQIGPTEAGRLITSALEL